MSPEQPLQRPVLSHPLSLLVRSAARHLQIDGDEADARFDARGHDLARGQAADQLVLRLLDDESYQAGVPRPLEADAQSLEIAGQDALDVDVLFGMALPCFPQEPLRGLEKAHPAGLDDRDMGAGALYVSEEVRRDQDRSRVPTEAAHEVVELF